MVFFVACPVRQFYVLSLLSCFYRIERLPIPIHPTTLGLDTGGKLLSLFSLRWRVCSSPTRSLAFY
jgi:hypothetical protein